MLKKRQDDESKNMMRIHLLACKMFRTLRPRSATVTEKLCRREVKRFELVSVPSAQTSSCRLVVRLLRPEVDCSLCQDFPL